MGAADASQKAQRGAPTLSSWMSLPDTQRIIGSGYAPQEIMKNETRFRASVVVPAAWKSLPLTICLRTSRAWSDTCSTLQSALADGLLLLAGWHQPTEPVELVLAEQSNFSDNPFEHVLGTLGTFQPPTASSPSTAIGSLVSTSTTVDEIVVELRHGPIFQPSS